MIVLIVIVLIVIAVVVVIAVLVICIRLLAVGVAIAMSKWLDVIDKIDFGRDQWLEAVCNERMVSCESLSFTSEIQSKVFLLFLFLKM